MNYKWQTIHIKDTEGIKQMATAFANDKPKIGAFDTETDGLIATVSKPFLIIFGWVSDGVGKVFTFPPEFIPQFLKLAVQLRTLYAHNTIYDLNMLANAGHPYPFDKIQEGVHTISDTMILGRLTAKADAVDRDRLGLKYLATKYVSITADKSDQEIKSFIRGQKAERTRELTAILKSYGLSQKDYTMNFSEKKTLNLMSEQPEGSKWHAVYKAWRGEATYADVPKDLMLKYASEDVIWTLELVAHFTKFIGTRPPEVREGMLKTLALEKKLITNYYHQQRVGFEMDFEYMEQSYMRLHNVIAELEKEKNSILGEVVSVGQHAVLKEKFFDLWGIMLEQTNDDALSSVADIEGVQPEAVRCVEVIQQLRTLSKWIGTYLCSYYHSAKKESDNRLHPSIKSTGAVSGRISSNFQQMPRTGIYFDGKNTHFLTAKEAEGLEEIFYPRKIVVPPKGTKILYYDMSQHELRVQASYTFHANAPDDNLIKAFMPYNMENPEEWEPMDLHALNAITCFGEDAVNQPNWKQLRAAGKTANFAMNYGAGINALLHNATLKQFSEEQIGNLYNAYKTNFPGVLQYQRWVSRQIKSRGYAKNLFGRPYLFDDPRWGYKCANYLVQGSCADMIKTLLVEVDELLKPYKSQSVATIHDEIQFYIHHDEYDELVPKIYKLMNREWEFCPVPIIVDIEQTETNWAEKKDVVINE